MRRRARPASSAACESPWLSTQESTAVSLRKWTGSPDGERKRNYRIREDTHVWATRRHYRRPRSLVRRTSGPSLLAQEDMKCSGHDDHLDEPENVRPHVVHDR